MEKVMLEKADIMKMFGMKSDRALRFMRMAKVNGYGIQIGRFYYIERAKLEKLLEDFSGLQLMLP